ncbi:MAG: hypothetical protein IT210_21635 [Armatimonadetes bacterium]|nr:hypothetical protein [Armatimonadota bacterium]
MTSRERVKTLLNRELPDRMGLFEHFWGETLADYWPDQGYPKGEAPEWHFGYDMVYAGGWFDTAPFSGQREVVDETEDWHVVRDGWGATMKHWKKKSGTPEHIAFEVTSPEKWRKYKEPLLEIRPERLGDCQAIKANLEAIRDKGKFAHYGNMFVYENMRAMLGDQTFLPAVLEDPDWIRDVCQTYLDFYRNHYEILFREAGLPDGFFMYEDFGYSKGLFCSPKILGGLVLPFHKAFVSFLKDYGLPVLLHSCGDIREAVPLFIDAGFDCLQPMEAKAGNDVLEFAQIYGKKLTYMGNINVVSLCSNDPARVRDEIVPKLNRLKQMGIPYLFHSDHSIPPSMNLKTYQYALELLEKHGKY